jgi:mRNA-degrading endonuclease RelE of RelBE toxin-antitoxin system
MNFQFEISDKLKQILDKLYKKDKNLAIALNKKIKQIVSLDKESIQHFKNLKNPLQYLKRVHVQSFVLTFKVKEDLISFEDFVHHDKAY